MNLCLLNRVANGWCGEGVQAAADHGCLFLFKIDKEGNRYDGRCLCPACPVARDGVWMFNSRTDLVLVWSGADS